MQIVLSSLNSSYVFWEVGGDAGLVLLLSPLLGRQYIHFSGNHFQFPFHLASALRLLRVDIVCRIFLGPNNGVAATAWDILTTAHGLSKDHWQVWAKNWLGKKSFPHQLHHCQQYIRPDTPPAELHPHSGETVLTFFFFFLFFSSLFKNYCENSLRF